MPLAWHNGLIGLRKLRQHLSSPCQRPRLLPHLPALQACLTSACYCVARLGTSPPLKRRTLSAPGSRRTAAWTVDAKVACWQAGPAWRERCSAARAYERCQKPYGAVTQAEHSNSHAKVLPVPGAIEVRCEEPLEQAQLGWKPSPQVLTLPDRPPPTKATVLSDGMAQQKRRRLPAPAMARRASSCCSSTSSSLGTWKGFLAELQSPQKTTTLSLWCNDNRAAQACCLWFVG